MVTLVKREPCVGLLEVEDHPHGRHRRRCGVPSSSREAVLALRCSRCGSMARKRNHPRDIGAVGPGHVVVRLPADGHVVAGEGRRPLLRPPEPLELAWVRVRVPQTLHRHGIVGDDRERERVGVGRDGGDGHGYVSCGLGGSASTASSWLNRDLQRPSSCASSARACARRSGIAAHDALAALRLLGRRVRPPRARRRASAPPRTTCRSGPRASKRTPGPRPRAGARRCRAAWCRRVRGRGGRGPRRRAATYNHMVVY